MDQYHIASIQEILGTKKGSTYKREIAVFLSDKGKEFRLFNGQPVYINAYSYMIVLSGHATLYVDGNKYSIDDRTFCILSPLHLTSFSNISDDFQCLFISILKSFIDRMGMFNIRHRIVRGISMHHSPLVHVTPEEKEILRSSIEDVRMQIARDQHFYQLEMIQNTLIRFYLETDNILDRKAAEKIDDKLLNNRFKNVLRKFIALLMSHYKTVHTVPFYARELNMTPQYLNHIIKSQTGQTVSKFVNEMIFSEARNLLILTESTIQEIALELNFSDQAAFCKFFKKRAGISPTDYRKSIIKPDN